MEATEAALESLAGEPIRRQLLRTCRQILRDDREEAQDAVQEALLIALQRFERFRGEALVSTWVYRIAVNAALMRLRSRRRGPRLLDLGAHPEKCAYLTDRSPCPETALHRKEGRRALRRCVAELPADYRTALRLRYFEDLTTREAARRLRVTPGAFKLRLFRARRSLRKLLVERYGELFGGQVDPRPRA